MVLMKRPVKRRSKNVDIPPLALVPYEDPSSSSEEYIPPKKKLQEKNVALKRKRANIDFVTQCRPRGLCEVISKLTDAQKRDVEAIGFGGLLKMSGVNAIPTKILRWLIGNFNGTSQLLRIDQNRSFVVTAEDIHDCFLLPRNEGCDVLRNNESLSLMTDWNARYKFKAEVSLKYFRSILESMVDGGDDFKRFFVLFSLSSFLTPSANRNVDFGVLRSVVEVENIKQLDWCTHVLNRLCVAVNKYKSGSVKNVSGCILVLQILYFHRLKWQGRAEPTTIPLIQHWDTDRIKKRVAEEVAAGEFGQGEFLTDTYPVSRRKGQSGKKPLGEGNICEEEDRVKDGQDGKKGQTEERKKHENDDESEDCELIELIKYKLPKGEMVDEVIHELAKDEMSELFMLLRRDMNVIFHAHMERVRKLQEQFAEKETSLSPAVELSETQQFFSSAKLHEYVDEVVSKFEKMKRFIDPSMPHFEILTPEEGVIPGMNKDVPAAAHDDVIPEEKEEVEDEKEHDKEEAENVKEQGEDDEDDKEDLEDKQEEIHVNQDAIDDCVAELEKDDQEEKNEKDLAVAESDERWPIREKKAFRCSFMKNHSKNFTGVVLSRKQKDVADYCFFNHKAKKDRDEPIFAHGGSCYVSLADMRTLNDESLIHISIIDTWALLLNRRTVDAKKKKCFYFYAQHSLYIGNMAEETPGRNWGESLRDCWMHWMRAVGVMDLSGFDLIFFPICYKAHFVAVVINFVDGKVQYLDNLVHHEAAVEKYKKLGTVVQNNFSELAKELKHPQAQEVERFPWENVPFSWQAVANNVDCGVFLMHHMENFIGQVYSKPDLKLRNVRRALRASFCSRILLNPLNEKRVQLEKDVLDFVREMK